MIKGELFGTEVGHAYRWPYDHAHPDCWRPPLKGLVLALDDVRAWRGSVRFSTIVYGDKPPQAEVTEHVQRCQKEGLLTDYVPVLYVNTLDGTEFVQWDRITALRPYEEELARWTKEREEKRLVIAP